MISLRIQVPFVAVGGVGAHILAPVDVTVVEAVGVQDDLVARSVLIRILPLARFSTPVFGDEIVLIVGADNVASTSILIVAAAMPNVVDELLPVDVAASFVVGASILSLVVEIPGVTVVGVDACIEAPISVTAIAAVLVEDGSVTQVLGVLPLARLSPPLFRDGVTVGIAELGAHAGVLGVSAKGPMILKLNLDGVEEAATGTGIVSKVGRAGISWPISVSSRVNISCGCSLLCDLIS